MRNIISFLAVMAVVAGCGTMDKKTNQLAVGDSKATVLELMGSPDAVQNFGRAEVLKYCVSGSSFGSNDHKDIFIKDGRLTGINAYSSSVTGCKNAIKGYSAPREEFSIAKAKELCNSFGFEAGTEGMANCLMAQQSRHDEQGARSDAARVEQMRVQNAQQRSREQGTQKLMQVLSGQLEAACINRGGTPYTTSTGQTMCQEKQTQNTNCHPNGNGGYNCSTR